jgi:S-layer protein (TIGR01567 family)
MKRAILQIFTAFLVLGLFCGAATAVPSINGVISPSNSTVVTGTVGATQPFTIPLNETATVTWAEGNRTPTQTQTDSSNIATLNHVIQSGSYQVTAAIDGVGQITKWDVVGTTGVPVITLSDPPSSSVSTNIGESKTFTVTVSRTSDIVWSLDGTSVKTDNSVTQSSYTNSSATQGTHTIKVEARNANGTAEPKSWTWTVNAKSADNSTGNRIWDESQNMPTTYTWDAQSFSGFYYDLDSGVSSEEMTITDIGRSIKSGNVEYVTRPTETKFEHNNWGSYQIIGFMAEKYFGGYSKQNSTVIGDDVSPISDGILSKILIDSDDKKSVSSGDSLVLDEGYSLSIKEVDVNGNSVWIQLEKDGKVVEDGFISSGGDYVYKADLGKATDVPLIIIHFGTVFSGSETSAVFVQGLFQISGNYVEVKNGDTFGEMEVKSISSSEIKMENTDSVGLDKGETIDLMGKIKIQVADDSTLRFSPIVDTSEAGNYELRGTVYDKSVNGNSLPIWTPFNFEGFYYNIDEGIGTEELKVEQLDGSDIPSDKLVYQSSPQAVKFEHSNWGNFTVVGFMADKYFAGYPDKAVNGAVDRVSLLSNNILSKVLIDSDDKESMASGSALALENGYSLSIKEVDVNGNSVWIQLEKDGKVVDDGFVSAGQDYVYKTDVGKATDIPLIIVHFGTVFSGTETSAVFVQGIFQISDDYTGINDGDTFGKMEVTSVSDNGITMKNSDDIGLDKGETTEVMNNVSFKTADADILRFYPFVTVGSGGTANGLNITVPDEIIVGNTFDITVTASGSPVEGVTVKVNTNSTGKTSANGTVQYTAENKGTLRLTAEKEGYTTVNKDVTVIPPKEEMSLSVSPETVYIGDNITIGTLKKIGGDPIEGVNVSIDGKALGETGSDGKITYKTEKNGTIKVIAAKEGFNNKTINVKVKDFEAIFKVSNLAVDPIEVSAGKNTTISANVENTGNAVGKYNATLSVNGNITDSKEISLDVGNNTTITFEHGEEVPGNYTVELGGQTATYTVKEKSSLLLYALGAVVLLIIGGAAYFFTKGGGDMSMLQEKVQELINSIKPKK